MTVQRACVLGDSAAARLQWEPDREANRNTTQLTQDVFLTRLPESAQFNSHGLAPSRGW